MKNVFRLFIVVIVLFVAVFSTVPAVQAQAEEAPEFLLYYSNSQTLYAKPLSPNMDTGDDVTVLGRPFDFQVEGNHVATLEGTFDYITVTNLEKNDVQRLPVHFATYFTMLPGWENWAYITNYESGGWKIEGRTPIDPENPGAKTDICNPAKGDSGCEVKGIQWVKDGFVVLAGFGDKPDQLIFISFDGKKHVELTSTDQHILNFHVFVNLDLIFFVTTPKKPFRNASYTGSVGVMNMNGDVLFTASEGRDAKVSSYISVYGTQVAYSQNEQIWVMDVAKTNQKQTSLFKLTSVGLNETPLFSTQGNYISFLSARGDQDFTPYYMAANGDYQIPIPHPNR
jgi:hypothetical protein